ncbi:ribbon-helix-helix protein, CopG family [Burkholderia stagnalis]|uniref:ribbon-helix-helix protein, CopG family n=1 Tax=Burkholderia stagnalis TaxID=1503054 RepID=UPI0018C61669|nr:ribbon-helix-helix protein, CopG family [Burkholderia stagnalis]
MDAETKDELERLACDAGMSLAEFLRELVMIRAYGQDHVCRLHRARLAAVAGTSPERED